MFETTAKIAGASKIGGNGKDPIPLDHVIFGFTEKIHLEDLWESLDVEGIVMQLPTGGHTTGFFFTFPLQSLALEGDDGTSYSGPDFSLS